MSFRIEIDDSGVPLSRYGVYGGRQIGDRRSPLAIAEYGLRCFDRLHGGDTLLSYDWTRWSAREPSLQGPLAACAEWLTGNITVEDESLVWRYRYPMSYGVRPGWCSAHAQATAALLLYRLGMWDDRMLTPFRTAVTDGGVDEDGWFEKFADRKPGPRVLNGTMFALLGLSEVPGGSALFEDGVYVLAGRLAGYDLPGGSAYDRFGRRASRWYHRIHVEQLTRLHVLTGIVELDVWRRRWKESVDG